MNRRSFIEKSSLGSAALFSPWAIPAFSRDHTLKIGLIGCGWYGMVIANAALKEGGVEVVAVCDVDSAHLSASADELEKSQGKRPKEFKDYRDLLETKGLEAVFIGTPPQWHALQFIAACEKGLDIYCEKPLAYDVKEGMAMMRAAERAGNIVQIGFQRRQSNSFKKAKELIESGKAGKIHEIAAHIHYTPVLADATIQEPPATLDWEQWCGPAPKLPYRPIIGHKAWRLEKEYGNGHLVDWGIHNIDITRQIMGFDIPSKFNSYGAINEYSGKITTPDTLNATMFFEDVPLTWQHRLWGTGQLDSQYNNGVFFYGNEATIFASDNRVVVQPAGKDKELEVLEIKTENMQQNHVADFLNAVKARDKKLISCTVEDAFLSTATVQLAMISYYTRSEIHWDKVNMNILDNATASNLLARPYRGPYQRPA
ncbi:MAG: Gfo/Idh/MocA family oxidoreductase [Cyclobacteriaceae bacterium]|nr:Gfo/Idh/MocA family oxidoreductase [Cyclobacteriaceae bacterium]